MDEAEFRDFLREAKARLPEQMRWMRQSLNEDEQRAVTRSWFDVLGTCDLSDAVSALRAIQAGEEEFPQPLDRLPQIVKRNCGKRIATREQRQRGRSAEVVHSRKRGAVTGLAAIFAEALAMKSNGAASAEVSAFIASKFPRASDDTSGPRFRCLSCEDTGWHWVASNRAIEHIRDGGAMAEFRCEPTCVVLCDCGRIRRREQSPGDKGEPVFDIRDFCPLPKCATPSQIEASVRDWLDSYHSPATRGNPVLAGWNAG